MKKPMLAVAVKDLSALSFPLLASPKLDGIRCLKPDNVALSRKFKPIPNKYVSEYLQRMVPNRVDGELIVRGGNFQSCQSAFMSQSGTPAFTYMLFDHVQEDSEPFCKRYDRLVRIINELHINHPETKEFVQVIRHVVINNVEELIAYEEKCVLDGYEGVMTRSMNGPYKNGRSTAIEQYLLKIKRWEDAEGVVIDMNEQMRNDNVATKDELGHTKRSSHAAGMTPAGTLGEFVIYDKVNDWTLKVGTGIGLTKEFRQIIWNNQATYLNQLITYKYQSFGMKDVPRFPIFKGFRSPDDMD